jgi:hypothetical protein
MTGVEGVQNHVQESTMISMKVIKLELDNLYIYTSKLNYLNP